EGRYAAQAIVDHLHQKPTQPFHYWNKGELATIGRSRAVAYLPGGVKLSGFLAWLTYSMVHLFYLIGVSARIRVFFSWAWSFLTFSRGARLIVQRPAGPEPTPAHVEPPTDEHPPAPQFH